MNWRGILGQRVNAPSILGRGDWCINALVTFGQCGEWTVYTGR